MLPSVALIFFAFLCLPDWLLASSRDNDWNNLDRLKAGDVIDVVQTSMGTTSGIYRSHAADSITIVETGGAERSFAKSAVVHVSRQARPHRIRNAALLGLAGAVIGAGAMRFGIACEESNNGCQNTKIATVLGGAAGAAAGALLPGHAVLIYRARP